MIVKPGGGGDVWEGGLSFFDGDAVSGEDDFDGFGAVYGVFWFEGSVGVSSDDVAFFEIPDGVGVGVAAADVEEDLSSKAWGFGFTEIAFGDDFKDAFFV